MESGTPSIIDLNAELAKLTMFRTNPTLDAGGDKGKRRAIGFLPRRACFWRSNPPGPTIGNAISPVTNWFTSSTASTTLEIVCDDGPPKSFALGAGMIAVIPQGAWHRAIRGGQHASWPDALSRRACRARCRRPSARPQARGAKWQAVTPDIVDLNAELAKLTMFQGRTPRSTMADRQGSAARLASYRDGALTATKFAGKGHWEKPSAGDELIHILDGMATLEIVGRGRAAIASRSARE